MSQSAKTTKKTSVSFWSWLRRWLWRGLSAFALFWLAYACFLLLGFVPVNRGYRVPPEDDWVRIFIRSSDIHTDFVMPVLTSDPDVDWRKSFSPRDLSGSAKNAKFVAIGWGHREFYAQTPTRADLKVGTLLRAMFVPSESVLHAEYLTDYSAGPLSDEVLLSRDQYRELATFIESTISMRDKEGRAITTTDPPFNDYDRFYLARGRYHMFNTCNQWTGRGLSRAGVPTGIWTPLVVHVRCQLPKVEKKASGR